ncbi:MAG: phage virion morphogenesis protein [Pseudomonadota bacterium]
MLTLSARAEGVEMVERVLHGLLVRFGDLEPLMDRLGLVIETQTDERFEAERAPDGTPWKPSIRVREQGGKTLTDSGIGRQSVTHAASADRVEVGTNLIYMVAHQGGATIRPRTARALAFTLPGLGFRMARQVVLPKREWLGLSPDNADELIETAEDWVAEVLPGDEA